MDLFRCHKVVKGNLRPALKKPLRVPFPILGLIAVDVLALKAHDLAIAFHDLRGLRPGLAVLPRDAADLHRGPQNTRFRHRFRPGKAPERA